jgi:hypothetical protein
MVILETEAQLVETLGLDRTRNVLIVGADNLGMALADYAGFNSNGFHIVAMVDADPAKPAAPPDMASPSTPGTASPRHCRPQPRHHRHHLRPRRRCVRA